MEPQERIELAIGRMSRDGYDDALEPAEITPRSSNFSASIGASRAVEAVPVVELGGAVAGQCFNNCIAAANKLGGEVIYGWMWHQVRDLLVIAEFHAVWGDDHGEMVDVTPPAKPRPTTTFSRDPVRVPPDLPPDGGPYAHHSCGIPNHRFLLKNHPAVHEFLAAEAANAALNLRRFKGEGVDPLKVVAALERYVDARAAVMTLVRATPRLPAGGGASQGKGDRHSQKMNRDRR